MNRNWCVETGRGVFALKQIIDVPLPKARRNLGVLGALAVAGVPVCPPEGGAGGDLVVQVGDRGYCLFPWVDGTHPRGTDLRLDQVGELGALLARIHQGLSRVGTVLPQVPAPVRAKVTSAGTAVAAADRFLDLIAGTGSPRSFDLMSVGLLEQRKILLDKYGSHWPGDEIPKGPFGWTHGDVQHRNILWRDGTVVAVLDWDRTGVRPYGEEVARTAQVQFGGEDGRLDLERVSAFVAGYRTVIDLAERDLADAVERLWWKRMTDYWVLEFHYDRGDHSCDDLWGPGELLLDWWTGHRDEVQGAFAARP
jgi:Ser/Thr protein kinase RdoA (MazF antagonist)